MSKLVECERVRGAPPSHALVYVALVDAGESVSAREVADSTGLSINTVYDALSGLVDAGVVRREACGEPRAMHLYDLRGDCDIHNISGV
jgi:sugar-specific transcriptional regulator TrmB